MGEPRECGKCQTIRYSDKYCEWCISLHLQSLFNTWTSGNKIIDDFIHQCQILSSLPRNILEWIPFDQFKDVKKLTEGDSVRFTLLHGQGVIYVIMTKIKRNLFVLDFSQWY